VPVGVRVPPFAWRPHQHAMDSELKITIEKPATWSRRMTITIPAERLEQEKQSTARKLAQKIRLPGFRKGKVPAQVLEKRFGPAIEQETIERVVGEAYREALQRENLQPITQPSIDNLDYQAGSDLTFRVDFDVKPEIELNRLGGFQVRRQVQMVTDEAVDRVLQRIRDQHAVWQPVPAESPVVGDMAVVEITPIEDGQPANARRYQIFLGEGQVRPEIEERIRTLTPGETQEFRVDLPENADDPNSPFKEHHIRVHLAEVQRPQYPALDDEFAKGLGQFDTMAALREQVRGDLEREAEAQSYEQARRELLDQVLQANPIEVPGSMVDRYLDQVVRPRKNEDTSRISELKQAARPAAEQAIRRMLVIQRIAELEGLEPDSAEVDAQYEELAQRHGRSQRDVRAQLKKEGREHEVEEQLTEDKVFRYLESLSNIG
jgi:trigger factor